MALSETVGNSVLISSQKPFTIFYELKSTSSNDSFKNQIIQHNPKTILN